MWQQESVLQSFLWLKNIPRCVYTTFCLSIHQVIDTKAVSISLTIMNTDVANEHLYISFCLNTDFHFSQVYTQEWNCWITGNSKFNTELRILILPNCFPLRLHHFTFPLALYKGFSFFTSLPTLLFSIFLIAILVGVKCYLTVFFFLN